jgi:NitT/TauT family transport system substrate-binding protein
MHRRTILKSSALLTLSALSTAALGSCAQQSTNTASTPQSGSTGASGTALKVSLVPWIGWSGTHIAEVKGFFKEAGITVEHIVAQTVTAVNTAFLANQVDLAWLVASDLLILSEQAPDLKYIMASDYSGEVDAILAHGITNPADLKGKKLAREDIPYEVVFVEKYLQSVGLTEKDVEIVSMPVPDASAAFVAGKVDAVATYEPFITQSLKARAGSTVLHTAQDTNTIANGLAGHGKALKDRRNDVLAYLRAVDKGMKFAVENPQEANEIIAKWVGSQPQEVADQLKRIKLLNVEANKSIVFNASNPLNVVNSIDAAAPILLKAGKIKKTVEGKTLVDDSLVTAL